ncbi:MAG: choice-of-anchor V domain-containing protein [Candidatus Binatia bacterium]
MGLTMENHSGLRTAARAALAVALMAALAPPASAHSNGQILASGKQSGFYCRSCHVGGTVPSSPSATKAVDAGSTATFAFLVGSQAAAQIAASSRRGRRCRCPRAGGESGTRLQANEVTHTEPKANDGNGEAAFQLTWQAPPIAGTYTLYGAGCSVDGNDQANGDAAARTTYEVVIREAAPSHPDADSGAVDPDPGRRGLRRRLQRQRNRHGQRVDHRSEHRPGHGSGVGLSQFRCEWRWAGDHRRAPAGGEQRAEQLPDGMSRARALVVDLAGRRPGGRRSLACAGRDRR